MYPLRFEPIYQYRLWGGRRLAELLAAPLPRRPDRRGVDTQRPRGPSEPGCRWTAQRPDHRPIDGAVSGADDGKTGRTLPPVPAAAEVSRRREMLSVQVHPSDAHKDLLPAGETGKTEAWVVLEAGTKSRIYAGLKPGTTADILRRALSDGTVADAHRMLHSEGRRRRLHTGGDGSHSGRRRRGVRGSAEQRRDVSPVRLGPCGRQDRPAAAAADRSGACLHRLCPEWRRSGGARGGDHAPVERERLFDCEPFRLWRLRGQSHHLRSAPRACRASWYASRAWGR